MPELPDVEGFRRVAERASGRRIERVELVDRTLLRSGRADVIEGERFGEFSRHGKWLVAPAGDAEVLMHFGMTGRLDWERRGTDRHVHDRIVFVCRGGELRYRDMRKFGGVWISRRGQEWVTGPLGPDAAEVDLERFRELLAPRRGSVKAALMDQRLIAGLGNLMVDEIAWRARVKPRTAVARLSRRRVERLWRAMDEVVRESLPTGRVPPAEGWLTGVRDAGRTLPALRVEAAPGDGGGPHHRVVRALPAPLTVHRLQLLPRLADPARG
jgi:formamidopyrimidine-DNA glycosylase